jgi:hypothetical protein
MFGRQPRLPIDLAFGIERNQQHKSVLQYTQGLRERLRHSYQQATAASTDAQERQKSGYDLKTRGAIIEVGDKVLVKTLVFDGKHKLADRWEEDVYIVQEQPNTSIPVFVVGRENGEGRKRTLHRNHLLPIGTLQRPTEPREERPPSVPRPRKMAPQRPTPAPRQRKMAPARTMPDQETDTEEEEQSTLVKEPVQQHIEPLAEVSSQTTTDDESAEIEDSVQDATDDDQSQPGTEEALPDGDGHMSDLSGYLTDTEVDSEVIDQEPGQIDPRGDNPTSDAVPTRDKERPTPTPVPRQSERIRRKPPWMTSGEFELGQTKQADDQEWNRTSRRIRELASSGILDQLSGSLSQMLLSLVEGHKE